MSHADHNFRTGFSDELEIGKQSAGDDLCDNTPSTVDTLHLTNELAHTPNDSVEVYNEM